MKKVLFITTRLINPVDSGTKVVLYNYCKGLNEKFNCEIYQYSFYEEEKDKKVKQPTFIKEIRIANQPKIIEKLWNILKNSFITRRWPLQVSLYYSKKTKIDLDKYIKKVEPDIVICDLARTAEYVKNIDESKYIKVLEMQDLISKRYKRQADTIGDAEGAFGAYSNRIPQFIRKILTNKCIIKKALRYESDLLEKYEKDSARKFHHIIFVSKNESEELNKLLGEEKCFDVSLGVDYGYFSEKLDIVKHEKLIGFIGNMNIAHNKDAVDNFINNILPELIIKDNSIRFRIIGMCSKEYKDKFSKIDHVEVTGPVEDLRKYSEECSIIVAPLTYGSGIKTKVLESMAMGIPVVTNEIGAEGINATNKEEIIICNNNEDFIVNIFELMKNENMRSNIAINGKAFVKNNFVWDSNLDNLIRIMKK